ncbi:MAG TPA: glutathione S-transferase C-terminal domain-containing protein, partial [Methylomirabilota bacterium]|nr:glutathione S-transferase C-terminal domain-containing protein [Methylomirabilota bacterium]
FAAYPRLDDRLVEARLLGRRFLVGDRPTIADVACFPMVALSDDVGIPLDRFHALSRYIDDIAALPGFAPMPGILLLPELNHP